MRDTKNVLSQIASCSFYMEVNKLKPDFALSRLNHVEKRKCWQQAVISWTDQTCYIPSGTHSSSIPTKSRRGYNGVPTSSDVGPPLYPRLDFFGATDLVPTGPRGCSWLYRTGTGGTGDNLLGLIWHQGADPFLPGAWSLAETLLCWLLPDCSCCRWWRCSHFHTGTKYSESTYSCRKIDQGTVSTEFAMPLF